MCRALSGLSALLAPGVAPSLVTASKAALPLCEARQPQDAVVCTGGMLNLQLSYRDLGWQRGAEHQGQLPRLCVVGTLRRSSFSLNSQGGTSQGSPRARRCDGRICALNNTAHPLAGVLLHTQAPASGDDSISMILSTHPSCQQSLLPLTILIFMHTTEPRGSAQPCSQLHAGHTESPSSFPGRRRREAWKTQI